MLLAPALAALILSAPDCGPLDLPMAQSLAVSRSDEVGIKRGEAAAAEADRAMAFAIRWLPEFNATVTTGVVPGARLMDPTNGNDITAIQSGSNRGLTNPDMFFRVEINALQPLFTWGRLDAAGKAAEAGAKAKAYLVDDTANAIRHRVLQLVMGIRLTTRLLGIATDVENALKDVDVRVQKSLKANDGEISPEDRYRIEIFRSQLLQRQADGVRALRVARVGLAATLALQPEQLQLRDEPLPDTLGVKPPDLAPGPSRRGDVPARPQGAGQRSEGQGGRAPRHQGPDVSPGRPGCAVRLVDGARPRRDHQPLRGGLLQRPDRRRGAADPPGPVDLEPDHQEGQGRGGAEHHPHGSGRARSGASRWRWSRRTPTWSRRSPSARPRPRRWPLVGAGSAARP